MGRKNCEKRRKGLFPRGIKRWHCVGMADDNFKLDENSRKFSKGVENTVGKGGVARYEQFLLFPLCFQKDLYCRYVKTRACLGKG